MRKSRRGYSPTSFLSSPAKGKSPCPLRNCHFVFQHFSRRRNIASFSHPPSACLCTSPLLWNQLGLLSHLIVSHPCQNTMHNTARIQYNMLRLPTATFSLPNFLFPCLSFLLFVFTYILFPLNI